MQYVSGEKNNKMIIIVVVVIIVLAVVGYFLAPAAKKSSDSPASPIVAVDTGANSLTSATSIARPQGPQVFGSVFMEAVAGASLGDEIAVVVRLDTGDKNITLVKVALEYDPQVLQWLSVDGADSVLPLQFREDDTAGKIVISRGVTGDADWQDSDDGYTGFDGLFAKVVFKVLSTGSVAINLAADETKMFLDDGRATEVHLALQGISFEVK